MSTTRETTEIALSDGKEQKIGVYLPDVDRLLEGGRRLEDTSREEYMEMDALERFRALADFYNQKAGLKGSERYDLKEIVDYVFSVFSEEYKSEPEEYSSEISAEIKSSNTTGSPGEIDLRKVVTMLETGEKREWLEYTGIVPNENPPR